MDLIYPNEQKLFRIGFALAIATWATLILATLGIALLYIGIFALFAIFAQSTFITHLKGNGIRITAEQYPDIYQRLQDCCERVGQSEIPQAYLLRTDFFNALATRFLRKHYIVLFTDVVDALQERPGALNFYLGHELGHIQRNHIRWGWVLAPVMWLPVLGSAYRRAEEYTCDRYGNACCESDDDAIGALAAIVAGDTRWNTLNVDAYQHQVEETGGFFMSLNELTGEYPWLCKRMAWVRALRAGEIPHFPKRSKLAGCISIFTPSIPGGAVSMLIIVAIVGVLAAVALPAYQSYVETAELAANEAQSAAPAMEISGLANPENLEQLIDELSPHRDRISAHYGETGAFPEDFTELGIEQSVLTSSVGLSYAVYEGGLIAVNTGAATEDPVYLVVEPSLNDAGEVEWLCYGQNMPVEALPPVCQ